jgi:Cdc6-like AAA superfamily ATPase
MVQASRTFRVFVSSTFDDLKAERNALQEKVFPRLKALCNDHGTRFQAIDLRWGVSEEAGRDQQTVAICLDEVKRCQKASPKPNFIVLLGDRYGWCPIPASIEADEFEEILAKVPAEDKTLVVFDEAQPEEGNGWYRRDDNAVPVRDDNARCSVYRLRERKVAVPEGASDDEDKAAHDTEEASWGKDEARMRAALRTAIDALGWAKDDERRIKYQASATEQEILRGVLGVPDAHEHVFGFFRTITNLDDLVAHIPAESPTGEADPDLPPPEKFIDLTAERVPDDKARARLDDLKRRLDAHLPGHVRDQYRTRWEGDRLSRDHLDQLCADVYAALAGVIMTEITQMKEKPQLEKEIEDHDRFGEDRAGTRFVGRLQPLERIRACIASADDHPLAVFGASGSGKSALMAAAAREAKRSAGDAVVIRFIGATPESSIGRSLLFSLCRQIARRYADDGLATAGGGEGEQQGPKAEADIPADYRELSAEFPKQLARATKTRPLVIFLDALDQLSAAEGARGLSWLPRELPEHVHLIVSTSTSPADCLEALRAKLSEANFEELAPMSRKEGEELLGVWLEQADTRLQPDQRDYVLDHFASASVGEDEEEQGGLPLYLKLAFEEARRWRSHDLPELHPTIRGVIRDDLFARLSAEANHGSVFVRHALGYLGAAKNGLSEDEMLEVLSLGGSEGSVLKDFGRRSPKSPVVEQLPVAVWSRLYFDLEPYLTERSADGTSLMGFYHRQLGEVVEEDYLAADEGLARHRDLAEYFALAGAEDAAFTLRQLSELPYQQTMGAGDDWKPLFETLTNFRFLEQKAATGKVETAGEGAAATYTGVFAIRDDFSLALERMPGGEGGGGGRAIIVTATDLGKGAGYQVRCPFCHKYSDLEEGWLGTQISCPQEGCGKPLKVNAFKAPAEEGSVRVPKPRPEPPAAAG